VTTHHQIGSSLSANTGGTNPVFSVAISPDGKILATTGYSGTTRLWDVAMPGDLPGAACSIAGGSFTRAEWSTYIGSQPFQAICP
jgi:WD40 repeat protein